MARTLLLEEAVPLLTLTGPGGVGKTRLAIVIAQDVTAAFADEVVWVDLTSLVDPTLVPAAVAAAIGVTPTPQGALIDDLGRALHARQMLLLLDNCEHVVTETAHLVGSLLTHCPALQVLATSRAPLHLDGEHRFVVEPLPLPTEDESRAAVEQNEAVQLFTERVRAVHPAFCLTERNAPTVAALCRQLDGLPLAIELAAVRGTILSPEAILAQMRDRLQLLTHGMRDRPARQQTIAATIAWSYDLLERGAQALFRRLAVFVGGFTLEAAQALVWTGGKTPHDVMTMFDALVEQSLVQRIPEEGEPRFRMLETVRAFGLDRLDETGERAAAEDTHAAYLLTYTDRAYQPRIHPSVSVAPRIERIKRERANIRAALAHLITTGQADSALRLASATARYVQLSPQEGRAWLEWALDHTPAHPTVPRGLALAVLGAIWWLLGDYERARQLSEASLAIAEHLDDTLVATYALENLGFIALIQEDYVQAQPLLAQVVERWTMLGDRWQMAETLQALAAAEHLLGEDAIAVEHITAALVLYHDFGYPGGVATGLLVKGQMARDRGDDRAALLTFQDALQLAVDGSDRNRLMWALVVLAELASRYAQAEVAAALLGTIDTMAREAGATRQPFGQVAYDRTAAAAITVLGATCFAEIRAAGGRLRRGDAVALARTVTVPATAKDEVVNGVHASSSPARDRIDETRQPPSVPSLAWLAAAVVTPALTNREQDVLALLCQHLTNAEIAARLSIGPRTVGTHVEHLLAKLGAANRREAAAIAVRRGLV
jgi:non-specific serine/threonine protein kinase